MRTWIRRNLAKIQKTFAKCLAFFGRIWYNIEVIKGRLYELRTSKGVA